MEEVEIIVKSRDGPKSLSTIEKSLKIKKIKQNIKNVINENKTFLNFLKENKIYGRYVKNTVNSISKFSYREDTILRSIRSDMSPINYGFSWSATSENYEFWKKYHISYTEFKNKKSKSIY